MKRPAISIIIPVYKAEKYLRRCLDSYLSQTFQDWQVVLVDDGSPDRSGIICDEYAKNDSRFLVIHQSNGGVSVARQTGIDNAIGDYTIHTDPDDWVEPSMLQDLYQKALHDNADMVICDIIWDRPTGVTIDRRPPSSLVAQDVLIGMFTSKIFGSLCTKLIKRSLYEKYNVSFPPQMSLAEDMYVLASLLKHDIKISYLDNAYYHYVIGDNQNAVSQKISQPFEYDEMIIGMFDELLRGNAVFSYQHNSMVKSLLTRAYKRNDFSNFMFCRKCLPYYFQVHGLPVLMDIRFLLSCLGFYKIMRKLSIVHSSINKLKK